MNKRIYKLFALLSIFLYPAKALAQPRIDGLVDIFFRGIDVALVISGFVAVGYIIYAGYMWMIAAGDPQKTKMAQGTITWAIIGLVFIFLISMILNPIIEFLAT